MEAGGRGVEDVREFLAWGGSILCGREEEDGGDKGGEKRYFRDGAESRAPPNTGIIAVAIAVTRRRVRMKSGRKGRGRNKRARRGCGAAKHGTPTSQRTTSEGFEENLGERRKEPRLSPTSSNVPTLCSIRWHLPILLILNLLDQYSVFTVLTSFPSQR